jgi:hypothetical protein
MLLPLFGLALSAGLSAEDTRPNILWITIEDWGPELSCYGTKGIHTPHVDKLASKGIRYQWAGEKSCQEPKKWIRQFSSVFLLVVSRQAVYPRPTWSTQTLPPANSACEPSEAPVPIRRCRFRTGKFEQKLMRFLSLSKKDRFCFG